MIYPSIDTLLSKVDSKYKLVHIAAARSREISIKNNYQIDEKDYISLKNIGKALEEIAEGLVAEDKEKSE